MMALYSPLARPHRGHLHLVVHHRVLAQVRGLPSKVGVREKPDERDRRAGHPALLRLPLPHGSGGEDQAVEKSDPLLYS